MAGRPKRRARLAKMIGAHPRVVTKGKRRCKKCGKNHSLSEHWSHLKGTHKGAKGETAWYGRKARPQGKRKIRKPAKRKARRRVGAGYTRGGTTFGPIKTTRTKRLKRMTAADMRRLGRAAAPKRRKARKKGRSPAQKAATARMLAALAAKRGGGGGRKKARRSAKKGSRAYGRGVVAALGRASRKKPRSAAQKAATKRMLAGLRAKRAGRSASAGMRVKRSSSSPRPIPMHLVKGHLASNPGRKPGKHRVRAHFASDPTDIRGAHRPRLG